MIPIFIGTTDKYTRCKRVIATSIRANATAHTKIVFMHPEKLGVDYTGCTGFTNMRYAVPELAGFQGYAIYLDIDMVVLGDIAALFAHRQPGKWVRMQDGASEVSVIDCAAHRHLPPMKTLGRYHKSELEGIVRAVDAIPPAWNVEDRVEPGMQLLHFTDLKRQPWFYNDHPCPEAVAIWDHYEKIAEQISVVPQALVGLA